MLNLALPFPAMLSFIVNVVESKQLTSGIEGKGIQKFQICVLSCANVPTGPKTYFLGIL